MAIRIFRNAWVRSRRAEEIAALANEVRHKAGFHDAENLNVIDLLRRLERSEIPGKGRLEIKIYPENPNGHLAYVSYSPLKLHVQKRIFERARWNVDPRAKYILAHETGHVCLHDHLAVPFSDNDTSHKTRGTEETQAEWQANCFADYLLLPDHIVSSFSDLNQLITVCNVEPALAERRFSRRQNAKKFQAVFEGDFCENCGNLCLVRRGYLLECDNCGESFSGLQL